jgi:thiol-disulfide isomerase/thioredoxin
MRYRTSDGWLLSSLLSLTIAGLLPSSFVVAQESATEAEPAPADTDETAAEPEAEVDPYEVPEGDVEELVEYLQTGPQRMRPQSRDDAVRMFQSLDKAATGILNAERATTDQRLQAAGARVAMLSRLQMFGDNKAGDRLRNLLDRLKKDESTELQAFSKKTLLEQKIGSWDRLDPAEQQAVLAEVREGLVGEQVDASNVVALMRLADAAAETPSAEQVIALIEEVLPSLRLIENNSIARRLSDLEGIVRRLKLPGNKMEVEGTLLSGEAVDWESYRGKIVLVDYWATWCGPCIAELPNVLAAYDAYHDKGFDVLGISLDDDGEAVTAFLEARKIPWQTLFSADPETNGWNHPMASKYAINGIPRAILVDQEGNVVSMNLRGDALKKTLEKLLGPPTPAAEDEASVEQRKSVDKTAAVAE